MPLQQPAGQAGHIARQFQFEQARLQVGRVQSGAGLQGIQAHRVVAHGAQQAVFALGAFATAEASFQAVYGYDVRGEVFGSEGVLLAGRDPEHAGRLNTELFAHAYTAQFAHFASSVRSGRQPAVTGHDARIALEIALAAAESVRTGAPVELVGAVPA